MEIYGIQKLTLLDYPEKTACTLFTGGCNLRCPFCHNACLVNPAGETPTDINELFAYLEKRRGVLDGVCVSGGEPLMHDDVGELLTRIKQLGYLIKIDTNGFYPKKLKELVKAGLVDYAAMDIKSSPKQYARASGLDEIDISQVEQSIAFLLTEPVDYEFRTTVVKGLHDEQTLVDAAISIGGAKRYYLQTFRDPGGLADEKLEAFSEKEMRRFLSAVSPHVKYAALRGI